jgi:hypothetical protein
LSGFLSTQGLATASTPFFDSFYGNVAALSTLLGGGLFGDYATYVLLTVFPFKIARTLGVWFYLKADKEGWLERYRIQERGKMPTEEQTNEVCCYIASSIWTYIDRSWQMYKTQISNWLAGFLLVELPLTTAFFFLRTWLQDYSIHNRDQGGWIQIAWKFWWALIVYDTW